MNKKVRINPHFFKININILLEIFITYELFNIWIEKKTFLIRLEH